MVSIEQAAFDEMIVDAVGTFPDECCGFIFGYENNEGRTISRILVVDNSKEGDKRRRFVISPKDYLKAERFADENNLQLLGVYHSHPNHPAIPSEHDRVAAQPWFSYIILSIIDGEFNHIRSWQLNNEQQFEEEKIFINQLN
ncbi:MAG: M67 family metallopeptidase [Chitinophagaceae bacterium]